MKNLRKLVKKDLKNINGGLGSDCPVPAKWCADWCQWTPQQKRKCVNMVIDFCETCP